MKKLQTMIRKTESSTLDLASTDGFYGLCMRVVWAWGAPLGSVVCRSVLVCEDAEGRSVVNCLGFPRAQIGVDPQGRKRLVRLCAGSVSVSSGWTESQDGEYKQRLSRPGREAARRDARRGRAPGSGLRCG